MDGVRTETAREAPIDSNGRTLPVSALGPALWGSGQIAVQVFRDVPSLLLLFYMTQILSVPAYMAGSAIFIPKLFLGATCDFALGGMLDRLPRGLYRRYFLLAGAVLAPLSLILLFIPSGAETAMARAWHISIILCLYMASFSIFSVPHLAIGTELSDDSHEQSRIMAWRTAFIGVGLLCGAAFAPFLVQYYGGGVEGYRLMSFTLAGICCASLLLAFVGSTEPERPARTGTGTGTVAVRGNWRAALDNRPFVHLFGAYFAQLIGQGTAYATLAYVVTFKLQFAEPLKILSLSVLVTGSIFVLVQPLLVAIVKRWGTRTTFMTGSFFYALSLVWIAFSPTASTASLVGASIALGLSNASTFQSVFTRLSAVIAADTRASPHARSRAGFYASLFVVNDKVAFALGGTLIAGSILSLFGFVPGGSMDQPGMALQGITIAFAGVPVVANAIAIAIMALSPEPDDRAA